jgi:carboxyl-terminal processing protease
VEVESALLPGTKVGYVRFNIWLMDLSAEIERAVGDLRGRGMESLVIDLRGNPGGVGAMVVPVGRLVLDRDADLGVMKMRGAEQRFAIKRGQDPFMGPVVILIDAGTASTSEIFAQALKDLGRAKIVGQSESQGAALPSVIEKLDGGAMLQYVVGDYTSPAGIAVEGKGVEPDVRVTVTREDLINGRDAVLVAAIAALAAPAPQGDSK